MCKSARGSTRQHTRALSDVTSEVTGLWLKQSAITVTYKGGREMFLLSQPSSQSIQTLPKCPPPARRP